MKIISLTGVLKSNDIKVTKGIGSLIVATSLALDALTNEKISVVIERGNGSNVVIANKIPLKDFVIASTYGTESVQSDENFAMIALCELADEASIYLDEKESILITLEGLISSQTYELYGVEEPLKTNDLYFFEQKTVASEEFSKTVDVVDFDLAIMTKNATIEDISYKFANNEVVKYLPFELETLSRDIDPIQAISAAGVVLQQSSNRLALPLNGVLSIEVNKAQGSIVNFVVRKLKTV